MVNVYVHLAVAGVPVGIVEDDDFVDALLRLLPDAAIGAHKGAPLTVTLSQWALRDRTASRQQIARVQRALATVGWPAARVEVDELVRESLRDDVGVLVGALRWRLRGLRTRRAAA